MPTIRDLIRAKRNGEQHSAEELAWLVEQAVAGQIPDYQLSAWLMAACFQHLSDEETIALTDAFVASGETLSWEGVDRPMVDKHSTGGVGDKVTLALAPWLAAAGLGVCKMSGRGLGHTGGTIDKLAAIPGFKTDLATADIKRILGECGCCVAQQSPKLVPADKLFYALRDATETVEELGLITASVMSKKLAFGANCIVLDVKTGGGAFFKTEDEAQAFARLAGIIADKAGRKLACVISPMDQPLGRTVGNAMEVLEAAQLLSGERDSPELREACLELGGATLDLVDGRDRCQPVRRRDARQGVRQNAEEDSGIADSLTAVPTADDLTVVPTEHRDHPLHLLSSGTAWASFQAWIAAQGGDWDAFLRQSESAAAKYQRISVTAPSSGTITKLDALAIGQLACDIGAGRVNKDDEIDPWVGIELLAKVGDEVAAGDEAAILTVKPNADGPGLAQRYLAATTIG
jgi:pyrimidine-nucleoside phosphorylase